MPYIICIFRICALSFLFSIAIVNFSYSQELIQHENQSFCINQKLGWNFYCDKIEHKKPIIKKLPKQQVIRSIPKNKQNKIVGKEVPKLDKNIDPQKITKAMREHLNYLKAKSVLYPTVANITKYIEYQKEQLDRAGTFASVWQRALWQNPKLDYLQQHPTARFASTIKQEEYDNKVSKALAKLKDRYGLFYFYRNDKMSALESPVIRSWSLENKVDVLPISMDGKISKDWEKESVVDTGQSEKFGLKKSMPTPVVMLYDKQVNKIIPVGFGWLSQANLSQRVYQLTQVKAGKEF